MTTTKMTYVDALNSAIACEALPADVREKLTALRDQQDKKRTAKSGKPTAAQMRNKEAQEHIIAVLSMASDPMTIGEMQKQDDFLAPLSNQLVANATNKLVDAGKVERVPDKHKALFRLISEDEEV